MKELNDYIEVVSLRNGDSFVILRLFSDTSLRETCYIKVAQLYEALKFAPDEHLRSRSVNLWVYEKTATGDTRFVYKDKISNISYRNLIDDCEEVQLFCKKYFPEMVI